LVMTGTAFLASCIMSMAVVQIPWNSTGQDILDETGAPAPLDFLAQLICHRTTCRRPSISRILWSPPKAKLP
jgi:hypothetical protein